MGLILLVQCPLILKTPFRPDRNYLETDTSENAAKERGKRYLWINPLDVRYVSKPKESMFQSNVFCFPVSVFSPAFICNLNPIDYILIIFCSLLCMFVIFTLLIIPKYTIIYSEQVIFCNMAFLAYYVHEVSVPQSIL